MNQQSDFSFKQAAIKILEEEKKPLSFFDITDKARNKGYLNTAGKTPERTMGAQALY